MYYITKDKKSKGNLRLKFVKITKIWQKYLKQERNYDNIKLLALDVVVC